MHAAVLAERAVERVPDDVDLGLGEERGEVSPLSPVDSDRVEALPDERGEDWTSGVERDLALRAEAAHEDANSPVIFRCRHVVSPRTLTSM